MDADFVLGDYRTSAVNVRYVCTKVSTEDPEEIFFPFFYRKWAQVGKDEKLIPNKFGQPIEIWFLSLDRETAFFEED